MIAAIPAEDRPTIIRQSIREQDRTLALKTSRIEAAHHYSNVLPRRNLAQLVLGVPDASAHLGRAAARQDKRCPAGLPELRCQDR